MNQNNPYSAPAAANDVQNKEEGHSEKFTSKGRLGRLRYFVYTFGIGLIGSALFITIFFLVPVAMPFLALIVFVAGFITTF